MVQSPTPTYVTVVPARVHTVPGVTDIDTVRPVAVVEAVTVPVAPTLPVAGAVMVTVWLRLSVIVAVARAAAFQFAFDTWSARTVQTPAAM